MYLDTANIDEIKEAWSLGILKGVTTNPSILLKEGKPREYVIKEILDHTDGIVFVQAVGETYEEMYRDCKEITPYGQKRIGLKIPASMDGLRVIKQLKEDNKDIVILATAIFSADQGILSAMAGADFIAPYVNRMENNNINPYEVVRKTRKVYDDHNLSTQILGASFKNTNQVVDVLAEGAHTATIPFDILTSMINKPLAMASIAKFNEDGQTLKSGR